MAEGNRERREVEREMLEKRVKTYKDVKSCLQGLTENINVKDKAVTEAVVMKGIMVNERLGEYFEAVKDEGRKEGEDCLKVVKKYADVYAWCKENVEVVKSVVEDKKCTDYLEDLKGAKTKKDMSKVIKDVMAVIAKDVEKIKEKIRREEGRQKEEEERRESKM